MNTLVTYLSRERVTVGTLETLYEQFRESPAFVGEAIGAIDHLDADFSYRAVWLLRRAAADKKLRGEDWMKIAEHVDASDHWIHRLCMCQLFAGPACPLPVQDQVVPFLKRCFEDRRVIVRAWALSAMMRFSCDPECHATIRRMLRIAERDPAKAMQARLRKLRGKAGL